MTDESKNGLGQGKPFLKWAGGKQWLAPKLAPLIIPLLSGRVTYFEPFLGGGAMFFALQPKRAILSDTNYDLIESYRAVRNDVELLIRTLRTYPHDEAFFEMLRGKTPMVTNTRGARLIYLNKTAFNGIYRVNADGQFNVPFGRYDNPGICQPARLRQASTALRDTRLLERDFEGALANARAGDLVYLDPPYITGHSNNGFHKYNARLFSWKDQIRLSSAVQELDRRGVHVLVSNASHPDVLRLYTGLRKYVVRRRSAIGGAKAKRGRVKEIIVSNMDLSLKDGDL